MSNSVENKVVSMKFDNSQFESRVSGTMRTLQRLKDSLNFSGQAKGLQDLNTASSKVNFGPMGSAVDGISAKFVAMSTVAITALANVTNRAVDAGLNIAKSLSLGPVMQGFQEYELNMNSIQTILANTKSKGSTLEDVNKALDELNTYADQTIYNFAEMSRNIGTFTAAGVDLDTSVRSIKGIANLAAISGSNSQQASTAMYQLSQAIAAGSVKLMDWNSVVNAGMGGEVFQKALFETGKQMGTIANVPMDQTFEQWTEAGNTFRGSLQDGWLTADVLTKTLEGFTGDLTEAQIKAMGYNDEQTKQIMEMGQIGKEAATKVKTATQLMDTLREGIGSGWAQSFRTIIGDFEEARTLFSGLGVFFGGIADNFATARNDMLTAWKNVGGRDVLVQGLVQGLAAVKSFLEPIRKGFRAIFPKQTAEGLLTLTIRFRDFMESLKLNQNFGTIGKLQNTFAGFFAIVSIGWNILKGIGGLIIGLFKSLSGVGSSALNATASFGVTMKDLHKTLVVDGGLQKFFEEIPKKIKAFTDRISKTAAFEKFAEVIEKIRNGLRDMFKGADKGPLAAITGGVDRAGDRFGFLSQVLESIKKSWASSTQSLEKFKDVVVEFADVVITGLGEIWGRIADQMKPGDFNNILDIANVGLLGGLVLLFKKFLDDGINIDFGGGLMEGIKDSFEALTGHLTALQTNVKADTLRKIAISIGILTASVLVLSLLDTAALTRALTAMAVGFGQIIAAMALLGGIGFGVKLPLLTASLVMVAGAMVILSLAVNMLAGLSWEELAKGLAGVVGLMAALTASAAVLSKMKGSISGVGLTMIGIAVAVGILSLAVRSFAKLNWTELGKGLLGVAGTLLVLTLSLRSMPGLGASDGLALIGMAIGLRIMANAVQAFGNIPFKEMVKGLLGVAGVMAILAISFKLMPAPLLVSMGLGLIGVGAGLLLISKVITDLGSLPFGELAKGIGAIAVVLGVLAAATYVMSGTVVGAAAIVVLSGALFVLSKVILALSKLSLGQVGIALLAIAGTLAVLGGMAFVLSPLIPALIALGIAMTFVGAGFALFGAGAFLVATAFGAMAKAGVEGVKVFTAVLKTVIDLVPEFIASLVVGLLNGITKIAEAAPALVRAIVAIASELLNGLITLVPKLGELIGILIDNVIIIILSKGPLIIATGFFLLLQLLQGIRDNIGEIVTIVGEIIVEFLNAMGAQMNSIVFAGLFLLAMFLNGIAANIGMVIDAAGNIVDEFIRAVGAQVNKIIRAGTDVIVDIITGIGRAANRIVTAGTNTVIKFLEGLNRNIKRLVDAGFDFVIKLIEGVTDSVNRNMGRLRRAGLDLAEAVINGFTGGLLDRAKEIADKALAPFKDAWNAVTGFFRTSSPSKLARELGHNVAAGFNIGMDRSRDGSVRHANQFGAAVSGAFSRSMQRIATTMASVSDFEPTITPVLDLTNIRSEASKINDIVATDGSLVASVSLAQARELSLATAALQTSQTPESASTEPREVKFEQNNYSPKALSTNDIYRKTNNQIELAKDELGVS